MNCLIVGGTAGLGLELAKKLQPIYQTVHIVGRTDPEVESLTFKQMDLHSATIIEDIDTYIKDIPTIDLLVHAPGFYQEGTVTDLSTDEINQMVNVCLMSAVWFTRSILGKQLSLPAFVAVTSTSQYTPRLLEPIYTIAKAGLGAYANSLSLDKRVCKTLVAGPAGMKTKFHEGREVNMSTYLDPQWVASEIIELLDGEYSYKYARILREPAHSEIKELR